MTTKRKSGGGAGGGEKLQRQRSNTSIGSASTTATDARPDVAGALMMYPFLRSALEWFDAEWAKHEDLHSFMCAHFPSPDEQKAWADFLDKTFPPQAGVDYLQDWGESGIKNLRQWQWSWDQEAGQKGAVSRETFRREMGSNYHKMPSIQEVPLVSS